MATSTVVNFVPSEQFVAYFLVFLKGFGFPWFLPYLQLNLIGNLKHIDTVALYFFVVTTVDDNTRTSGLSAVT